MKILLKRNSTAGLMPAVDELELGEIAINTVDGKMFTKIFDGSIEEIKEIGNGQLVKYQDGLVLASKDAEGYEIGRRALDLTYNGIAGNDDSVVIGEKHRYIITDVFPDIDLDIGYSPGFYNDNENLKTYVLGGFFGDSEVDLASLFFKKTNIENEKKYSQTNTVYKSAENGTSHGDSFYVIDNVTREFQKIATFPDRGIIACMIEKLSDGNLIIVGGSQDDGGGGFPVGTPQKSVFKFDTTSNTFTQLNDFPREIAKGGIGKLSTGEIIVWGGMDADWEITDTNVYRYNEALDSWTVIGQLPDAFAGFAYGTSIDNKPFFYLGVISGGDENYSLYYYDENNNTWYSVLWPTDFNINDCRLDGNQYETGAETAVVGLDGTIMVAPNGWDQNEGIKPVFITPDLNNIYAENIGILASGGDVIMPTPNGFTFLGRNKYTYDNLKKGMFTVIESVNIGNAALGKSSIALGQGVAASDNQVVVGQYNIIDNDAVFIVGAGTEHFYSFSDFIAAPDSPLRGKFNDAEHKNALTVFADGRVEAPELSPSLVNTDRSLTTKETAVTSIPNNNIGEQRIARIVKMTQADYDNITPDPDTLYVIVSSGAP